MCERFANWLVGWFIAWVMGAFLAGCCMRFEVVTMPDPATQQWMQSTNEFNAAVKKQVEQLDHRVDQLEKEGEI